jgi:hypothetical protein
MKMFPLTLFAACGVALATTAAYAGDDESKQGSGQAELQAGHDQMMTPEDQ